MWTPWKNSKGSAKWVTIFACATVIQLGLCAVVPVTIQSVSDRLHLDSDAAESTFSVQVILFWLTVVALFVSLIWMFFDKSEDTDDH